MKTDNSCAPGDPVWTNGGMLLNDECLPEFPVIENCQVSSLLSNLEPSDKMLFHTGDFSQNIDVILPNSGYRLQNLDASLENNFMILKEDKSPLNSDNDKKSDHNNFKDLLYFVCNLCPFLCTSKEKISHHLKSVHSNENIKKLKEIKCPGCANIFYHKLSLRSHLIHDHNVASFDINKIIHAVIYYASIKEPKKEIKPIETIIIESDDNSDTNSTSPSTNFTIFSPSNLNGHKTDTKETKKTDKSNFTIFSPSNLSDQTKNPEPNKNKLTFDQQKLYKCNVSICKVRMQDPKNLKYHMQCHSNNEFKCVQCGELFSFWKPLAGHLWRSHKIDMELYACNLCDYKSFSLGKLNNVHKRIHSEVRSFTCTVCHKAFKNKQQLRNHRSIHRDVSEKLVHVCEQCQRKFSSKRSRDLHIQAVHDKTKPYSCNFCSYKSSSATSLNMHQRQHTGERPFSCDECAYKTSDHNSLRRHKLRHSGQKPYKCAHCPYACIQSTTYKLHLKSKHPGLEDQYLFSCNECQFRFINKDMYTTHMVSVHKKEVADV